MKKAEVVISPYVKFATRNHQKCRCFHQNCGDVQEYLLKFLVALNGKSSIFKYFTFVATL